VGWLARLYGWAARRLYHECTWAYDAVSWLVSLGRWASWRAQALDYVTGGRVLEIGFGTGELLIELARRHRWAVGLEPSPAMHRIAERKLRRRGLEVPRVQAVAQRMPFADGAFDAIVSTFPAGYILDPATLQEAARLLRPSGRFVVVGMVVDIGDPRWRRVMRAVLGCSSEEVLAEYTRLARAASLEVTVVAPPGRGLSVPIVLSERP